jgi:hypothetical protein
MREQSREVCDRVVRGLARLSLVVVLALMAALFVGGAAVGRPQETAGIGSSIERQDPKPAQEDAFESADPAGLVIGILVIGGGLLILTVGAFKPHRGDADRELADILRD